MAYRSAYNREDGTGGREGAASPRARPLLPPLIANTMADAARVVLGAACLAGVAVLGASLASWSPADPSLTHATSAAPHNLLGRPGAMLADLMIETFGLSALAVVLPPLFWGLTLIARDSLLWPARRMLAALTAVAVAAASFASVPAPEIWPAHHGLGGFAGEAMVRMASAPLAQWPPLVVRTVEGAGFAGLAIYLLAFASGAVGRERTRRTKTRRWTKNGKRQAASKASPHALECFREKCETVFPKEARQNKELGSVFDSIKVGRTLAAGAPELRAEPEFSSLAPNPRSSPTHKTRTAAPTADARQFGPYAQFEPLEPGFEDDEACEFDAWTKSASGAMAARFAPPAANGPQTLLKTVSHAFNAPIARDDPDVLTQPPARTFLNRTAGERASTDSYKRPSLNLLERSRGQRGTASFGASLMRGNARLLEDVMAEFGVVGTVRAITSGPVITVYEFEPARGIRIERIVALADDIARGMGLASARIASVAGQPTVAVELPNEIREAVTLRDVLDTEAYRSSQDILPVAIGRTATGTPVVSDLTRLPHLLVAGGGGSGRAAGMQAMILSLVYKHGPENCRFLMIDQKMVELARFEGIPHLLTPIVSDPHKAVTALAWCVREMEERMKRMAAVGVRAIDVFNNRVRNAKKRGERMARTVQTGFDERTGAARFEDQEMNLEPLPYIVIVIEELADLMAVAGPEIEGAVKRLAEAAKQAGIHLIVASERPNADVVTPAIKGTIAARISYRVNGRGQSRAVLGCEGAEQLLGGGDMLYTTGVGEPARVHGVTVSESEIDQVADHLRAHGKPRYVEALMSPRHSARTAGGSAAQYTQGSTTDRATGQASRTVSVESEDALFDRAVAIVVREGRAYPALLQRRLNISLTWAVQLVAKLEQARVIGPADHSGFHPMRKESAA